MGGVDENWLKCYAVWGEGGGIFPGASVCCKFWD